MFTALAHPRRLITRSVLALGLMLGSSILPSVANASDSVKVETSTQTMTLVAPITIGSEPDANGNVQVTLSDGGTISIPSEYVSLVQNPKPELAKSASGATAKATVYGNCGSSYINLYEKSNGAPVRMETGFRTYDASVSYNWNAGISGPQYQYNYGASGGLNFKYVWNGQHTSDKSYPRGTYYASVSSNYSYALLYWGGICSSGGPSTSKFL